VANFKRGKPKQSVRCTLCTQARWRGNHQGRFKEKEEAERLQTDPGGVVPVTRTKSPKRSWSRNKKIRSLRGRLASLLEKQAASEQRKLGPSLGWLADEVRRIYGRQIKNCEKELEELGELV
jgi:hypothetical protein